MPVSEFYGSNPLIILIVVNYILCSLFFLMGKVYML
jgi:hypothetical protein